MRIISLRKGWFFVHEIYHDSKTKVERKRGENKNQSITKIRTSILFHLTQLRSKTRVKQEIYIYIKQGS